MGLQKQVNIHQFSRAHLEQCYLVSREVHNLKVREPLERCTNGCDLVAG